MSGVTRAMALWAGALVLGACGYVDGDKPAAPQFALGGGAVVEWRLPKITLEGTAEFGARVKLESDKAFGGATAPSEQVADVYTARFRFAGVGLAPGLNTFTIVATDEAGNASEKATLQVDYRDVPQGVELMLSANTVVAGSDAADGKLRASARIVPGVEGFAVKGRKIVFVLGGVGEDALDGETDESGRASVEFPKFARTGAGTVTAYFADRNGPRDSAPFTVAGGAAASLQLKLVKAGATGEGADTVTVTAGEDVEAKVVVKDAQGNVVPVPVALFTDVPGALVSGMRLTNLKAAGSFRIVASVSGAPTDGGVAVSDEATVTVNPSGELKVTIIAPATAVAGEVVRFSARITDSFGNAVTPGPDRTLTFAVPEDTNAVVTNAERTVVFKKAGAARLVGTLAGVGSVSAEAPVTVLPGAAETLSLAFSGVSVRTTPDYAVQAAAAAAITVTATVKDAFDNAVTSGVALSTNSPGAFDGTTLKGLTKAGSYEVRAQVVNTGVVMRRAFSVLPGPASTIALQLGAGVADAGAAVRYTLSVTDTFGNVASDAVVVGVDGLGAADFSVDAGSGTLVVRKSSETSYTVRARPVTGTTPAAATAILSVRPGAATSVAIDVEGANTYAAGATPRLTPTVKDAFNNVVANPSLSVSVVPQANTIVEPPGPIYSAGRIYNLIRPGTYQVVAQVAGTGVVNSQTDSEATITVTAGTSASVELSIARSSIDVGSPLEVGAVVRDAFGNRTADAAVMSVLQGTTTVASNVGSTWTPTAAGSYTVRATVAAVTPNLSDSKTVVVSAPVDSKGPTIAIERPLNDPTIATWPPPDRADGATCEAGQSGDLVSATATDPSLVEDAWITIGGAAANRRTGPLTVGLPQSPFQASASVCAVQSSDAVGVKRGEVLVQFAAADLHNNFAIATGSWCIDPEAGGYQPANAPVGRCAVVKGEASIANAAALASNDAGDVVIARGDDGDNAFIRLFERSRNAYGLGTAYAIKLASGTALGSPRGVALSGRTAFTSVTSSSRALIWRTRALDAAGGGTSDAFVNVDTQSTNDRFEGLSFGADGALYALNVPRALTGTGAYSTKLYRFEQPLDASRTFTSMPGAAVVSSSSQRLSGLCRGARTGEFYATGTQLVSGQPRAVAVRIFGGAITPLFQDSQDGRTIGGCALTSAGLVTTLAKTGTNGLVTVIDTATGAAAAAPYLNGYSASAGLGTPLGVALATGYVFVATTETGAGSLLRFSRPGGF